MIYPAGPDAYDTGEFVELPQTHLNRLGADLLRHGCAVAVVPALAFREYATARSPSYQQLGTSTFLELADAFRWLTAGLRSRVRVRIQLAPPFHSAT
jgi:hypothetical protein